jgi:hypothetical protein
MNRINFAKYGFELDGDAYVLPAAPNLRIKKHVSSGHVDITAHIASNQLTYEECKALPKYEEAVYGLSGKKTLYELTDEDIQTFVENCIILSNEVDKAIETATVPTDEELKKKYDLLHAQYVKDYADAEALYNGLAKKCILNGRIDVDGYAFKWGMQYLAKAMSYSHNQASVSFEEMLERLNKSDYYYSSRVRKLDYLASTIEPTWYIKSAREYFEEALKQATEKN